MNIAILIRSLGGGGAERVAQIIGNYYVEGGNKVYYFLGDTSVKQVYAVKGTIVRTGIKSCLSDNIMGNAQIYVKLAAGALKMRRYKKIYKIDVAISFMEEFNYINILSKGKEKVITRVCTILSEKGEWVSFLFDKKLVHFFYPKADRIVVMSECAKMDMIQNFGIPSKKLVRIPNPVLPVENHNTDDDWQYGDKVIISVGRLAVEKQQERMIKAFSYVHVREPEAILLILGTGPRENYLKNMARKYKVDKNVVFIGFKKNVTYYLHNSRLFVLSSKLEGFPNAMLEAMTNGLPVITTDSPGGCREIVGKKNESSECRTIEYCLYGVLTPRLADSTCAEQVLDKEELLLGQAMLEFILDNKLCEKYSKRSLKRASMYCVGNIMEKWNKMIGYELSDAED